MRVIIIGMGRVGITLTEELCKEGHNIIAIEKDSSVLQECVNKFDIQGICGNGCSAEILKEADIDKCDMFIAVTPQDEINILCCIVARALGAKNLVAHVRDPEYYEQFEFLRGNLGIDMFVNPEQAAAQEMLRVLRFPAAMKVNHFSDGKVTVMEFKLPPNSKIEGLSLIELRKKIKSAVLIVAIERDGSIIVPNGETVLRAGDVLNVCARYPEMRNFFRSSGIFMQKAQSVMILGGGEDVFYLARELEESGFFVKIICNSYERCEKIKGGLNHASVVYGDYTDRRVLEREGIESADALVSMSHYDENNIVTALFAKTKGVKKTITVLHGDSYRGILESVGIDTAISPYRLAATQIARYLRSIDGREGGVKALYKLADERVEALLFNIGGNSSFTGKMLKDLSLQKGILIAAAVRGKNVFIPDGNFIIGANDDIVVISSGKLILELEDILRS